MPDIHPSALIDPDVKLADDVYVGPGCVLRGSMTIGKGCKLHGNAYLHGPLTMGGHNRVYPFTTIGFSPQDSKFNPATPGAGVVIGDDNVFREGFTCHRATKDQPTKIGSHCFFMVNSHVAHDCVIGDRVTLVNGVLLAGHVHLGEGVIIGRNSVVHQFVRIGRLAMMGGMSGVIQDVPPFCAVRNNRLVASLNRVGLRRAGLRDQLPALQKAFDIIFKGGHSNRVAAERVAAELGDHPLCAELAEFVRTTKRGICHLDRTKEAGDTGDGDGE